MQASQDNYLELVQMLSKEDGSDLDHASNVNLCVSCSNIVIAFMIHIVCYILQSTWTALTTACKEGKSHEDIVIELTKAGADINKKKQVCSV